MVFFLAYKDYLVNNIHQRNFPVCK